MFTCWFLNKQGSKSWRIRHQKSLPSQHVLNRDLLTPETLQHAEMRHFLIQNLGAGFIFRGDSFKKPLTSWNLRSKRKPGSWRPRNQKHFQVLAAKKSSVRTNLSFSKNKVAKLSKKMRHVFSIGLVVWILVTVILWSKPWRLNLACWVIARSIPREETRRKTGSHRNYERRFLGLEIFKTRPVTAVEYKNSTHIWKNLDIISRHWG